MTASGRARLAKWGVLGLLSVVLVSFPLLSSNLYLQNMAIFTFLLAIGATSWNVMGGYAGYISLGTSAFTGLGAYTTGILALHLHLSPFVGCFVGGLVAGAAAAVLSLVTRRTRGMYFVIVTFAALLLLGQIARNWSGVTGGAAGLPMPIPGWDISMQDWPFYYSLLALLAVAIAVSALVRRSKLGMGLFAIQDDEDKAAGVGIPTATYKLVAFVVGSTFVGIAGGIYGYYVSYLDPSAQFDVVATILMVLAALLGGRGTVWGPVLGAFLIEPVNELTTTNLGGANAGAIRLLMFAAVLVAVVMFLPRGVLPSITDRVNRNRQRTQLQAARTADTRSAGMLSAGAAATRTVHARSAALAVEQMVKRFGGVRAVDGVDLTVNAGSVTGLMGPNGSGKTTLFNLIDGTTKAESGSVLLAGQALQSRSRTRRAQAGLARTYQLPRLFSSLTVVENIVLPETSTSLRRFFKPRATQPEAARALAVLAALGLDSYADISPAHLSYGQRKLIELAQVLTLDPVLVMLDEPAAGISPALSQRLAAIIRDLNQRGVAILLVEHDLAFVSDLCEEVYVMASGRVIAKGTVAAVSADPVVIEAYLGEPEILVDSEGGR